MVKLSAELEETAELIILCGFVTTSNHFHITNIQLFAFWIKIKSNNCNLKVCQWMELVQLS